MFNKAIVTAILATIFQYYDYALYGFSISKIAQNFFPQSANPLTSAYMIFASAVIAKPLGALFISTIGDKFGRSKALQITSFGIAIPTFIIGITPSYEQIGSYAICILLFSRLVTVAFAAAELDGVRVYIFEKIDPKRRFFANSVVTVATQIGAALAALAAYISNYLPDYGFRIPFIIGGFFGLIIFYLRRNIIETELFKTVKQEEKMSYFEQGLVFFLGVMISGLIGASYNFHIIFFINYVAQTLKLLNITQSSLFVVILLIFYSIVALIAGKIKDYIYPKFVITFFILANIILLFFNIYFLQKGYFNKFLFICTVCTIPFYSVGLQVFLKQISSVSYRYRLYSCSHALGSAIISSTTPYFSMLLWDDLQIVYAPVLYCIVLLLILLYISSYLNFNKRGDERVTL